jgi:hypothetical protein
VHESSRRGFGSNVHPSESPGSRAIAVGRFTTTLSPVTNHPRADTTVPNLVTIHPRAVTTVPNLVTIHPRAVTTVPNLVTIHPRAANATPHRVTIHRWRGTHPYDHA